MRIALLFAASTLALAAHAGVTVTFVEPEKYTDAGRFGSATDQAKVQKDLEAHLVKLGQRMSANQNLAIEILDIDLAGEDRFHYGGTTDVRIQRGRADWPAIRLRYTLEGGGRKEIREARLSDMNYQQRVQRPNPTETLPHEKRMLTDWFDSLKLSTQAR